MEITDAMADQGSFQRQLIELGRVFRIRLRTRVHDDLDLMILEHAEENADSMIGMTYSQDVRMTYSQDVP